MGATDGGRRGFDAKPPRPPAAEPPPEPACAGVDRRPALAVDGGVSEADGAETPRLDAEVLLAHALGCRRIELYTAYEETPAEERRGAFRELVAAAPRGRRWPISSTAASSTR